MRKLLSLALILSLSITGFSFSSFAQKRNTEISKKEKVKQNSQVRKNNKRNSKKKNKGLK